MELKDRLTVFKTELSILKSDSSRLIAQILIELLPDYFFNVAASSSGKYHPSFALGEGGLIRHTQMAIRIAEDLMQLEQYSALLKWHDEIIIALMFHDGWKHGNANEANQYTTFDHALVAANEIHNSLDFILSKLSINSEEQENIKSGIKISLDRIAHLIESHMGQWNTSKYSDVVLPKPEDDLQKFVHLCDYLASRKWVIMQ